MKAELHRLTVNGKSAMVVPLRDHRFYRFKYSVGNFQGDYRDVDNEIAGAVLAWVDGGNGASCTWRNR